MTYLLPIEFIAAYALVTLLVATVLAKRISGGNTVRFGDAFLGLILGVLWPVIVPAVLIISAVKGMANR